MFYWNSVAFSMNQMDTGNLMSGSSAFSKSSLNIWKFLVQILLKPHSGNFEHYFASMWDEFKCAVVWIFFGIAFLWDWNENWPFPVLWSLLSFPNLLAYWVQHFHKHHLLGFEIAQLEFHLFMGFSRQEYWSGLPFPSPVDHILSSESFKLWLRCGLQLEGWKWLTELIVSTVWK